MNPKRKKILIYILKIVVAGGILAFVYNKLDTSKLQSLAKEVSLSSLLCCTFSFVLSKYFGALRLAKFIKKAGYTISHWENIGLYLQGMFYNLFLPGGIGGDGYKMYYLKQKSDTALKDAFFVFFIDRISGMFSLCILAVLIAFFIDVDLIPNQKLWLIGLLISGGLSGIVIIYFLKKSFFKTFLKTFYLSFLVQISQVIGIYFVLLNFDLVKNYFEYFFLFLVSSIVSIIPITPGGLGLRELTYHEGAKYFGTSENIGVMIGTVFFTITFIVSFAGIYYHFTSDVKPNEG